MSDSTSKKRPATDAVDCEKSVKAVWLVKVPRYLSEIWEKNAGSDVGNLKTAGDEDVHFVSTVQSDSGPSIKSVHTAITAPILNGRNDIRKVPNVADLKPLGPVKSDISIPKEHRFKFTRLDQTLGILLEDKTGLKDEKDLKSGKVSLEGRVVKRAEIQPPATKEYMNLKKTMICKASQPTSTLKKVDRVVNTFKPRANQTELLARQKAKKDAGIRSARADKDVVMDMIFKAFEKHQYYALNDLAKVTGQPPNYIREILTGIGVYNTAPPHKSMWELKPEYRNF
uniref:General transcription factor IIF subunit 2 n=1 Tax=Panagrolaimus sp. JU765 TaxID=591449 RepID=A0AC34QW65_9BILA